METVLIVAVVVALLLIAGGGVRHNHGRNAEEMTALGDRVPPVPGFERRDGPLA